MNKFKYYVDSPWNDRTGSGKAYPLTKVVVKELKGRTVTKTGKIGRTVQVTITGWNGCVTQEHAVCTPPDKFSFDYGAKLAMRRALDKIPNLTKKMRTSIWDGLFACIGMPG